MTAFGPDRGSPECAAARLTVRGPSTCVRGICMWIGLRPPPGIMSSFIEVANRTPQKLLQPIAMHMLHTNMTACHANDCHSGIMEAIAHGYL